MQNDTNVPKLNSQGRTLLRIPRVNAFLRAVVDDGTDWKQAARENGIRIGRARFILADKAIRAEYYRLCDVNRLAERARNIHVAAQIRDAGASADASAAERKAALEAMRYIDGDQGAAGITINGGTNVIAGYVVHLEGPVAGPRGANEIQGHVVEPAKPLIIEHE